MELIQCPHCRFWLEADYAQDGSATFQFEYQRWQDLCLHPRRATPALCIAEHDAILAHLAKGWRPISQLP